MSIRNDKPNYVTVNSDTYKPIIKYYSYLMPIASISNDIKCVSSEKIIDNKTHLIELIQLLCHTRHLGLFSIHVIVMHLK